MTKLTTAILISLISILGVTPAFAQDDGYDMPEYLDDVMHIDPHNASALDFLDDTSGENYVTRAYDAYMAGDYENSSRLYIAKLRDGKNAILLYNLACNYSLMGEVELAVRCIEEAAETGFADSGLVDIILDDPDLASLRGDPGFEAAAAKIIANAEAQVDTGERVYFELSSLAPGAVILPDDYDPDRAYPVLVALHGAAHTPERVLELRGMCDGTDFIFVALRAQNPTLWEGQIGYNWVFYGVEDEDVLTRSSEMAEQYIRSAVDTVKQQYKTDGVYIAGFSDGGAMAYITGIRNPGAFDGVIPIGGYFPEQFLDEETVAAGNSTPIFVIHGTADTSVAYEGAEEALAMFREAGYRAKMFTHDGGHVLHEEGMKAAQAWLGF